MSTRLIEIVDGPWAGRVVELDYDCPHLVCERELVDLPIRWPGKNPADPPARDRLKYNVLHLRAGTLAVVEFVPRDRFASYGLEDLDWLRYFGLTKWRRVAVTLSGEVLSVHRPGSKEADSMASLVWKYNQMWVRESELYNSYHKVILPRGCYEPIPINHTLNAVRRGQFSWLPINEHRTKTTAQEDRGILGDGRSERF